MSYLHAVLVAGSLLLSACVTTAPQPEAKPPAEQKFAEGLKSYDDGDLKAASTALTAALDLGLASKGDQVAAHKHLAFIHCVSRREKLCREEFRKALEIDPAFDLLPAEVGHPLWGSVFLAEKAKLAKQSGEATTSATANGDPKTDAKATKKKQKKGVRTEKKTAEAAVPSSK